MKKHASIIATIAGIGIAFATAVLTIDFKTFEFSKEWPKLLCYFVIACGGIFSKVNFPADKKEE